MSAASAHPAIDGRRRNFGGVGAKRYVNGADRTNDLSALHIVNNHT
jgi:hypothetical protein